MKKNSVKSAVAMDGAETPLSNAEIGELLAAAAETSRQPLQKAFRRAARKALLWPEEATSMLRDGQTLTELPGVGPYLEKIISKWLEGPPPLPEIPDIRRDFFTWTRAQAILQKASSAPAPRGDLQMHTLWSDGSGSIQEMAEAGEALGYQYIAITDHFQGLKIAGGINEEQLTQQAEEVAAVNDALAVAGRTIRVLHSLEVNLNPTGEADMSPQSLAKLDLVLGCFHSSLRKKEDQTERYMAALRNPLIQILGHPRGRIYNFRLGLTADWARVFALAAELDKAVEIDSYPDRQDMSLDLIRLAAKAGCRISLGTDSHGPSQLRFIAFGLAAAIAGGIDHSRVLNFMTREELLRWVGNLRS
jgi:histidinol phosphatase-like PHP family hydrolase